MSPLLIKIIKSAEMISQKDAETKVRKLQHLYEATVRNGFIMPKPKSAMVTREYLEQVSGLSVL